MAAVVVGWTSGVVVVVLVLGGVSGKGESSGNSFIATLISDTLSAFLVLSILVGVLLFLPPPPPPFSYGCF